MAPAVPECASQDSPQLQPADSRPARILEDQLHIAVDTRTEALQTLRELGPPDLVHLVKQTNRTPPKQVGVSVGRIDRRLHG